MNTISLKQIFLLVILVCIYHPAISQIRSKTSINSLWRFQKQQAIPSISNPNTSDWEIVNLPHTWNDKDVLDDGNRGYYRGKGFYFKKLHKSFTPQIKNYFLHFEGANQYAEVYVNGQKAGEHIGGYSAFTIDITSYLNKGKQNELLVMVDNTHNVNIPPLSADFTFFGGIYRDLFLIETSKIHFNILDHGSKGIFVDTPLVNSQKASVAIKGSIRNTLKKQGEYTIQCKIYSPDGILVTKNISTLECKGGDTITPFRISDINITNPLLWSPDSPHLYKLEISISNKENIVDDEYIKFGIRTFSFDADSGFFLNGKPLKLMGANRHQDYPSMGNALSDDQHRSDLKLLKDMGGNFIRLAHYPQDPAILEEADRIGLLVWEETPLVNEVSLSKDHNKNSEVMLKEMIRQHYNHPSIIIWGYMNEIYWAHRFIDEKIVDRHTEATLGLARRLENIARTEDPKRYTGMALHRYPLYEESGIDKIPQIVGWNLYHGWYYDTYGDFGKYLDQQHEKYPGRIHMVSEFGAGSDPRFHSIKPERFDFTIEGHKRMMESYLKQILERPYIAGASVWNLIDFSSERRIDPNPHMNNKGLMSADRTPKDVLFLFQAALSKTPYLKIAETNWTNRAGLKSNKLPVQVYSNLDEIELFQDGISLGRKKINNHSAIWEINFKDEQNQFKAEGYSEEKIFSDLLNINYKGVPKIFNNENHIDISINAGSNHSFYDDKGKNTWLADKKYEKGGWGYLDGEPLYVSNKIGTKEDILTINGFIGLYQTMRKNTSGYRFDVKDGWYEVELLFVEHYPKSRRFVDGVESPKHNGQERIFDVNINKKSIFKNWDILKDYGYNYPIKKKVQVKATNNSGVYVQLKAIKGETRISGIRIRSL
ncbi:glycoside hydrolase family 2 TIM barrel-domain containing protein [Aquimarina gracilis]|uniref:Glycoside hydrolase family 2 TIM barrel-domain containing protein n=1 Tax=Aquimarina gracilis TaxID=874422 RepID=A0ABU5ZQM1_9FLAO|nr:glycoside hydrolase family 2 TIM barrel-domain containing protein [Aquimarina gracilis]MEB3343877.1 glycoside hydrolase family 2 TIM barrel-domain containing protein [Aquimarina gracilis]